MTENSHPFHQLSLSILKRDLYTESNFFVYLTYYIQTGLFFLNLALIYFKPQETNLTIWLLLILTVGIILLNKYFLNKSKIYYSLAEKIRKLEMIENIFPNAINNINKSYLLAFIPASIIEKAKQTPNQKTTFISLKKGKYERLIENIQENCYFTSEIMRIHSKRLKTIIVVISILFCISVIYCFYLISDSKIDDGLNKIVAGYLALFINFILTLNIYNHFTTFKKKVNDLKKIDSEISNIKQDPHEDQIISFFSEYNCVLADALPCPNSIFDNNVERLNQLWENRINSNN